MSSRRAEKHIDRGEELTQWSKVQILVGHFFVQNGYFLLALSLTIRLGCGLPCRAARALSGIGPQIGETTNPVHESPFHPLCDQRSAYPERGVTDE